MVSLMGKLESLRSLLRRLMNLARTKNGLLAELAATGTDVTAPFLRSHDHTKK
jgi:hypothetical protein